MKVKRILAGILTSAAFLTTLSLCVSAASPIETQNRDWTMNTTYSQTTDNGAGYLYYHPVSVGNAYAYTQTNLSVGMYGYASVLLKADNNKTSTKYVEDKIANTTNGYIRTENASVSGSRQAESVRFMGARYEKSNTDNPVGFNYYIH